MCGIVGVVAERNAVPILMEGLRRLEYRDYNSAGVAVLAPTTNWRAVALWGRWEDLLPQWRRIRPSVRWSRSAVQARCWRSISRRSRSCYLPRPRAHTFGESRGVAGAVLVHKATQLTWSSWLVARVLRQRIRTVRDLRPERAPRDPRHLIRGQHLRNAACVGEASRVRRLLHRRDQWSSASRSSRCAVVARWNSPYQPSLGVAPA